MQGSWDQVIGKTIRAVVAADSANGLQSQVFLMFSDGSNFKIVGPRLSAASELGYRSLDAVVELAEDYGGSVQVFEYQLSTLDVDSGGERDS